MLEHYLSLGGVEIANSARLAAYLDTVGSPLDSVSPCGCPTFDADLVGDAPYTIPEGDDAPWYDPDVPASRDFAGLMVLKVAGMDDHPVTRTATSAVTGGAALGPARVQPRTITVTAVLLGSTCCGVTYGLKWLAEALAGCTGNACGGDCLHVFNCCPSEDELADDESPGDASPGADERMGPEEFAAKHRRTLRRVALTGGPTVTDRVGNGCTGSGACQNGADMLTVEFVLTAGTPWLWTDAVPVLAAPPPGAGDDGEECITWCLHDPLAPDPPAPACLELTDDAECQPSAIRVEFDTSELPPSGESPDDCVRWPDDESLERPCAGTCRLARCPDEREVCQDPGCRTPTPPVPPPPETCFCHALAVEAEYYDVDLSSWPGWFGAVPIITAEAGATALRHVSVRLYERTPAHQDLTCEQVAEMERCNPHSVYEIAYVPPQGVVTVDGQVRRATVECAGVCETSTDVYGAEGMPPRWSELDCDRYCVEITADAVATPAADAWITLALSGREY